MSSDDLGVLSEKRGVPDTDYSALLRDQKRKCMDKATEEILSLVRDKMHPHGFGDGEPDEFDPTAFKEAFGMCIVCTQPYGPNRIPDILSCNHTICHICSDTIAKSANNRKCPHCRKLLGCNRSGGGSFAMRDLMKIGCRYKCPLCDDNGRTYTVASYESHRRESCRCFTCPCSATDGAPMSLTKAMTLREAVAHINDGCAMLLIDCIKTRYRQHKEDEEEMDKLHAENERLRDKTTDLRNTLANIQEGMGGDGVGAMAHGSNNGDDSSDDDRRADPSYHPSRGSRLVR